MMSVMHLEESFFHPLSETAGSVNVQYNEHIKPSFFPEAQVTKLIGEVAVLKG